MQVTESGMMALLVDIGRSSDGIQPDRVRTCLWTTRGTHVGPLRAEHNDAKLSDASPDLPPCVFTAGVGMLALLG